MDIVSYLVIFAALAAGAVVKGATGMGLPLVALPALAAVFGLPHAIGIMVIPVLVSNAWQLWRLRSAREGQHLGFMPVFLVATGIGVMAGTWLLKTLPERWLIVALGVLLVGYVIIRLMRPSAIIGPELARRAAAAVGLLGGVLNGATGISAPISVTFIHWMRLERDTHVFVVSAMFLVMGMVQWPALVVAGLMQPYWLVQGLFALVPILLFMPIGRLAALRMSRDGFDRLVLIFLGLIGVKMLVGL